MTKEQGGKGRADVWYKGRFAIEYKQPGADLDAAYKRLAAAVLAAYGWQHDVSDEEILARLLALNLARAAGTTGWKNPQCLQVFGLRRQHRHVGVPHTRTRACGLRGKAWRAPAKRCAGYAGARFQHD